MNKKLKQALKQNYTPPPTQHKEQFLNNFLYPKETIGELLASQIGFIRKRVWLLFMLSICFAFFYTKFASVPENIVVGVSAILPMFSLCLVSEIYKSTASNMEELELACKCNLLKITLIRIGILGTVSFAALLILVIIVGNNHYGLLRNTLYIGVPYLLSSYLSLLVVLKLRSNDTAYICAAISGVVSVLMASSNNMCRFIHYADFTFIWLTLFVLLIYLLFYSLIQFIKSQEELQWNLL